MSAFEISYRCTLPEGTSALLAPGGLETPHGSCTGLSVEGGTSALTEERATGQRAFLIRPEGGPLTLTYLFDEAARAPYPEAMFAPIPSRFTRYAAELAAEAEADAGDLTGLARAIAIANATAERFTYGHPEARFNDGLDAVPALGCTMSEGSCVDINTYFIAALRAAGIEAGYVTGYFFPQEKRDHCADGHCWVVTRIDGAFQEWDIAHHLKLGTRQIAPALNPKPGFRAGVFHSMGLSFTAPPLEDIKALIEPVCLTENGPARAEAPQIRLHHPAISGGQI